MPDNLGPVHSESTKIIINNPYWICWNIKEKILFNFDRFPQSGFQCFQFSLKPSSTYRHHSSVAKTIFLSTEVRK